MLQLIKNKKVLSTRLSISPITLKAAPFVRTLFNTSGWLKYIGDRNIHSIAAAENFISSAICNTNAAIWTISKQEIETLPLGIITLVKRDFLSQPDIGYALLPNAMKMGYAKESTLAVIDEIKSTNFVEHIYAISLENNIQSLNLLNKLHFNFEKEIIQDNEALHLYKLELTQNHS